MYMHIRVLSIYLSLYIYIYIYPCTYTHICTYIHIYVCIHTPIYIYIYIHAQLHVLYVYIYIYIHMLCCLLLLLVEHLCAYVYPLYNQAYTPDCMYLSRYSCTHIQSIPIASKYAGRATTQGVFNTRVHGIM